MNGQIEKWTLKLADYLLAPLTFAGAVWLRAIRRQGIGRMRVSRAILKRVGVLPIRDHYYEPLIDPDRLTHSLRDDRNLPGIDLNIPTQLAILSRFHFAEELLSLPLEKSDGRRTFFFHNGTYEAGDAEYLYSMIRLFKPKRVVEIGSGSSTLMAREAISRNAKDDPHYRCEHTCIEPFECPWLEELGVVCIRDLVEHVDHEIFRQLEANDILFIDSSHVIRPQGDVLFLYHEVLPSLKSGVIVHIHDIFTPKDYLDEWVVKNQNLWNEQYLLEAFLALNRQFEVIGALNYLAHHYPERLAEGCPIFGKEAARSEPGAFWIRRT